MVRLRPPYRSSKSTGPNSDRVGATTTSSAENDDNKNNKNNNSITTHPNNDNNNNNNNTNTNTNDSNTTVEDSNPSSPSLTRQASLYNHLSKKLYEKMPSFFTKGQVDETYSVAVLVISASILCLFSIPFFVVLFVWSPPLSNEFITGLVVSNLLAFLVLINLRLYEHVTVPAHVMLLLMTSASLFCTFELGGFDIFWSTPIPVVPLLAAFLLDSSYFTFFYLFIAVIIYLGLYILMPQPPPDNILTPYQVHVVTFVGGIVTITVSCLVGCLFAHVRSLKQKYIEKERDRASELAEIKGQFTCNVSHEIRTPLNSIIGLVELLACDSRLDIQDHRDTILTVLSASLHLGHLLDSIVDFSKLEAGIKSTDEICFHVETLLDSTLRSFSPIAENKGVRLIEYIEYPHENTHITGNIVKEHEVMARVKGDAHRLRQVVQNVVGNSLKFTGHAKGEVYVFLRVGSPDSNNMIPFTIEIEDNGIGINKESMEKVEKFQPFTQVDASTTRRYGGTGLGLAICRQICEMMGGTITMKSTYGVGTIVTITLKLKVDDGLKSEESGNLSENSTELNESKTNSMRKRSGESNDRSGIIGSSVLDFYRYDDLHKGNSEYEEKGLRKSKIDFEKLSSVKIAIVSESERLRWAVSKYLQEAGLGLNSDITPVNSKGDMLTLNSLDQYLAYPIPRFDVAIIDCETTGSTIPTIPDKSLRRIVYLVKGRQRLGAITMGTGSNNSIKKSDSDKPVTPQYSFSSTSTATNADQFSSSSSSSSSPSGTNNSNNSNNNNNNNNNNNIPIQFMCASNPVSRTHLLNAVYSLLEGKTHTLRTPPIPSTQPTPTSFPPLHSQISPFYPNYSNTTSTTTSMQSNTNPTLSITTTSTSTISPMIEPTQSTTISTQSPVFVATSFTPNMPSERASKRDRSNTPQPFSSSSSSSNNQAPENNSTMPPKRVLVAEDNELNQRVVHRQFGMLGVEIDMVSNGYEALKAYENKGPYNAIFLDCQMPVMDGYESSRQIRELERQQMADPSTSTTTTTTTAATTTITPATTTTTTTTTATPNNTTTNINANTNTNTEEQPTRRGVKRKGPVPIVALTASTMPNEKRRCMESGMSNFLSKPLKISELKACLIEVGVLPSNQNV